jgi:organic radical activating enzyme
LTVENSLKIIFPFRHSFLDYPDPEEACLSFYMLGYDHACKDCSSSELQDFNYISKDVVDLSIKEIVKEVYRYLEKFRVNKIVLIGGDPLHPKNITFTKILLKKIKNVSFCIYTGYDITYVKKNKLRGFSFLKTGCYDSNYKVESEKTDEYIQFASTNQKLYDMNYKLLSENGRYYF